MKRKYIPAEDLLIDSTRLAVNVFNSGYQPDFVVGLWRGGSTVGITVHAALEHLGVATDHIAIRTSYAGRQSYSKRVDNGHDIRVHGLQYLLENLEAENSLLIVDDVYGTGSSIAAVIEQLTVKLRRNLPQNIRTAAVWYRPGSRTTRPPDYRIHTTEDWLVLPYELTDLTLDEIRQNKPGIAGILDGIKN